FQMTPTKPPSASVWAQYANSLLPVTAVFGAIGLLLLGLSLLASQRVPDGTRGFAVVDLAVAAIAALVSLGWRWRQRRSDR
ncbi:MAG: hypothetical protein M3075_02200, partial [Candidatus Dormibacteraeota bacterium]|nr:hypothetical protein [Candidatus Dormibacteraeota bacterium]